SRWRGGYLSRPGCWPSASAGSVYGGNSRPGKTSLGSVSLGRTAFAGDQVVGNAQHVGEALALHQVLAIDDDRRRAADLAALGELLGRVGLGVHREAAHGGGELLRIHAVAAVELGEFVHPV